MVVSNSAHPSIGVVFVDWRKIGFCAVMIFLGDNEYMNNMSKVQNEIFGLRVNLFFALFLMNLAFHCMCYT